MTTTTIKGKHGSGRDLLSLINECDPGWTQLIQNYMKKVGTQMTFNFLPINLSSAIWKTVTAVWKTKKNSYG